MVAFMLHRVVLLLLSSRYSTSGGFIWHQVTAYPTLSPSRVSNHLGHFLSFILTGWVWLVNLELDADIKVFLYGQGK